MIFNPLMYSQMDNIHDMPRHRAGADRCYHDLLLPWPACTLPAPKLQGGYLAAFFSRLMASNYFQHENGWGSWISMCLNKEDGSQLAMFAHEKFLFDLRVS